MTGGWSIVALFGTTILVILLFTVYGKSPTTFFVGAVCFAVLAVTIWIKDLRGKWRKHNQEISNK
jgi:hypothetical protein